MQIISYETKDSQAIATFFRKIFEELGWTERPSDHMDEPHLLFHLPNKGLLIVAKENGQVFGTAGVISLNKSQGLMKRFYLDKAYRGSGMAQQLLEELLIQAKKMGIKKLVLDVSKNNPRAIRFYEKSRFLPTTIEPQDDWPESKEPESHMYFYMNI